MDIEAEMLRQLPRPYKAAVPDWPTVHTCPPIPTRGSVGPTITKPDLDEVRDVTPKALRPYKVVGLD